MQPILQSINLVVTCTQLRLEHCEATTASASDAAEIFMSAVPYRIQWAWLPLSRGRWITRKGRRGDPTREELWWRRKKWKSEAAFALLGLWSPSSRRHWYTDTHKGTQALSLPSYVFSLPLPLSSPPYPFIFTLGLLQGSPCPIVLTTRLLSRLWYLFACKINSILWIHFSSYHYFNKSATKPRLFNRTDSHLFVIHSHYHFPKALKHMHAELTSWFL